MTRPKVEIKGIRDGLLITVGDGDWEEVRQALFARLDEQAEFMRGARVALDLGNHVLKAVDMSALRNEISGREVSLWAVLSNSPTTEKTAQTLGLATRISKPRPDLTAARLDTHLTEGEPAVFVERTLRSGYSLKHPESVILIGDVNPGAEIISGGNVIVWGRVRGMVHAGSGGNEKAFVAALDLSPTQLRIADKISIAPQRKAKPQPEIARLVNGQVVAEPWNPRKH